MKQQLSVFKQKHNNLKSVQKNKKIVFTAGWHYLIPTDPDLYFDDTGRLKLVVGLLQGSHSF